ncbi:transposase [Streptomyces sp. NPDC048442]|uniref:transposase n=1 Tax=Streptomyces sp. NPDC048442 TaxID=3154823 RepID=UPI00343F2865
MAGSAWPASSAIGPDTAPTSSTTCTCHGRRGEKKTFAWQGYRDLIVATHQKLGTPLVWCRDNFNLRLVQEVYDFAEENKQWLRIFQLPSYAPELIPAEGIWSVLRRTTTANRAFRAPAVLITAIRHGLRQLQYRHDVLDGCLTGTGLLDSS